MNALSAFFRGGMPLCVVLGMTHGAGANDPRLAWLQALSMTGALLVCFHARRTQRTMRIALLALSFTIASSFMAHSWLVATLTSEDALGPALGWCMSAALMTGISLLPAASIVLASRIVATESSRWLAACLLEHR